MRARRTYVCAHVSIGCVAVALRNRAVLHSCIGLYVYVHLSVRQCGSVCARVRVCAGERCTVVAFVLSITKEESLGWNAELNVQGAQHENMTHQYDSSL